MKLTFRVECPHCHWGYAMTESDINKGFIKAQCSHCQNTFFFKISVTGVNIEVQKEINNTDIPVREKKI